MQNPTPETLLSKKETAEYLRVSIRTIDNLRLRNGLPALRVGGKIVFQYGAIRDWLENQQKIEAPLQ